MKWLLFQLKAQNQCNAYLQINMNKCEEIGRKLQCFFFGGEQLFGYDPFLTHVQNSHISSADSCKTVTTSCCNWYT